MNIFQSHTNNDYENVSEDNKFSYFGEFLKPQFDVDILLTNSNAILTQKNYPRHTNDPKFQNNLER